MQNIGKKEMQHNEKTFKKTSIALTIVMMFIPAIFGGKAITIHTHADNTNYKTAVNAQGVKTEKKQKRQRK